LTGKPLLDENGVPILKLATTLKAGKKIIEWTEEYGCMCRNPACSYTLDPKSLKEEGSEVSGAAWCPDEPRVLKGYIDYELARHALCVDEKRDNFKRSRQCSTCGYVHRAWMPPRYKRLKKMFSMIAVDEIHNIKTPSSDQSQAILGMTHAKRRVGATGTLMPNNPQDAFYPTSWVFGNRNHLFSFSRGQAGVQEFNDEYTDHIVVESENSSYAKIVPFIKKPIQFWSWKASKCHFRAYTDPAVIAGMAKAGLKIPSFRPLPTELVPEPKQGLLLVASIEQFDGRAESQGEGQRKGLPGQQLAGARAHDPDEVRGFDPGIAERPLYGAGQPVDLRGRLWGLQAPAGEGDPGRADP
jgi:hypothetical protein